MSLEEVKKNSRKTDHETHEPVKEGKENYQLQEPSLKWIPEDRLRHQVGISLRTMQMWRAGGLRSSKVGRKVFIHIDDFNDFFEKHTEK